MNANARSAKPDVARHNSDTASGPDWPAQITYRAEADFYSYAPHLSITS